MRPILARSVFSKSGQQTYRVPGGYDAAPASVTVAGAAATFTSAVDVSEGTRTITISAPTISTDGQEIRMNFDGLSSGTDPITSLVENPENLESGLLTVAAAGASTPWLVAIGNRNVLTISQATVGTGTNITVEVTNDPLGVAGWTAARGANVNSGAAAAAITAVGAYTFKVGGFKFARVRFTAQTSGTSTLYATVSYASVIAGSIV